MARVWILNAAFPDNSIVFMFEVEKDCPLGMRIRRRRFVSGLRLMSTRLSSVSITRPYFTILSPARHKRSMI